MWQAWERREMFTKFWWESPKEGNHSEDQGVDGRIGSGRILERLFGDVEWVHMARDRDRWRAVVKTVMSLWVLEQLSLLKKYDVVVWTDRSE
jgi:hypothetical protein